MIAELSGATPALPPPPVPPEPGECCGQGCVHCVYVVYDLALLAWEREVERILATAKSNA